MTLDETNPDAAAAPTYTGLHTEAAASDARSLDRSDSLSDGACTCCCTVTVPLCLTAAVVAKLLSHYAKASSIRYDDIR